MNDIAETILVDILREAPPGRVHKFNMFRVMPCDHEPFLCRKLDRNGKPSTVYIQCQKCGAAQYIHSFIAKHKYNIVPGNITARIDEWMLADAKIEYFEHLTFRKEQDNAEWRERYNLYLSSPAWQQKRQEAFTYHGVLCQMCGDKATQVHHLTYKHLENESMEDLAVVCRNCHEKIHGIQS